MLRHSSYSTLCGGHTGASILYSGFHDLEKTVMPRLANSHLRHSPRAPGSKLPWFSNMRPLLRSNSTIVYTVLPLHFRFVAEKLQDKADGLTKNTEDCKLLVTVPIESNRTSQNTHDETISILSLRTLKSQSN